MRSFLLFNTFILVKINMINICIIWKKEENRWLEKKRIHTHVLAFRIDVKRVRVATEDTSESLKSVKITLFHLNKYQSQVTPWQTKSFRFKLKLSTSSSGDKRYSESEKKFVWSLTDRRRAILQVATSYRDHDAC